MENQLPAVLEYNERMLKTLRDTVAKGCSPEEFHLFVEVCKASKLNPLKSEIWCIKAQGGMRPMTGYAGFLRIANEHPQFDGLKKSVQRDDKGNPISAIVECYRKDRKFPAIAEVLWSEVAKNHGAWTTYKTDMILKCAGSRAIREAFATQLGGLHTIEESPEELSGSEAENKPVAEYWYDFKALPAEQYSKFEIALSKDKTNQNPVARLWLSDQPLGPTTTFAKFSRPRPTDEEFEAAANRQVEQQGAA